MNIETQIDNFIENYYSIHGKNSLFKKNQKNELATQIASSFKIEDLLENMCYIINDKVIIKYSIFKLFVHNDIYETVINFILKKFDCILQTHDNFECHVNIEGFTMSAAERYQDFIKVFADISLSSNNSYSDKILHLKVYFPPVIIEQIKSVFGRFVDKEVKQKVEVISKNDSISRWNSLVN